MPEYTASQLLGVVADELDDPEVAGPMSDRLRDDGRDDEAAALQSGQPFSVDAGRVVYSAGDLIRRLPFRNRDYVEVGRIPNNRGGHDFVYMDVYEVQFRSQWFPVYRWRGWQADGEWTFDRDESFSEARRFVVDSGGFLTGAQ